MSETVRRLCGHGFNFSVDLKLSKTARSLGHGVCAGIFASLAGLFTYSSFGSWTFVVASAVVAWIFGWVVVDSVVFDRFA